jgi:hypothetical protein
MSIFEFPDTPGGNQQGAPLSGTATLVAGTVAISIPGLTANSKVTVSPKTLGGTLGGLYRAVCTAGTLTITSIIVASGLTQTLDTSVVQYVGIF